MLDRSQLHERIAKEQPNICGLVVLCDGYEVLNDTWNGWQRDDTVHTMSVTKSITSLLVGIAIEQGLIHSIDDPVLAYFPDYRIKRGEKTLPAVTLRHLLTMTAPYKYRSEPWSKICVQDDWSLAALDFVGGRGGITGEYRYATLGIHILNGIIAGQSGLTTVDYANRYLFAPLGIADRMAYVAPDAAAHKTFVMEKAPKGHIWFSDPVGVGTAGFGLCLTAGEMAKIGQLCLQDGVWQGKQIIPADWLHLSTRTHVQTSGDFQNMQYGFLWWVIDAQKHIYAAIGNSGNVIYINPKKRLVAAVAAYFKPTVFDRIQWIQALETQL